MESLFRFLGEGLALVIFRTPHPSENILCVLRNIDISNHPLSCVFASSTFVKSTEISNETSHQQAYTDKKAPAIRVERKSAEFAHHPKSCPCPENYGIPFSRKLKKHTSRNVIFTHTFYWNREYKYFKSPSFPACLLLPYSSNPHTISNETSHQQTYTDKKAPAIRVEKKSAEFAYHPKSCLVRKTMESFFRSLGEGLARVIFKASPPSEKILCVLRVGKEI
ncbi:hypothetical protein CEXT_451531 [Caerostris extrusa]|uniref:Uncharacterized protein n=1 Tax=Caerostris extrusa TaxID=172846 RepID=A0AAV4VG60_CAEEX|nr:hypothetical protein CEXT_451531 [Caerostris extrusa]